MVWLRVGIALWVASALGGCSSKVDFRYAISEPVRTSIGPGLVSVQRLADARSKGSNELGVVRGGYGNVLKRVYTDRSVAELVTNALEQALATQGLLANEDAGPLRLEGSILKLDCNHYFRREAHTRLVLSLVDAATGEKIFSRRYEADETGISLAVGIFARTKTIASMAERTLRDAIDQALADPDFIVAASTAPRLAAPAGARRTGPTSSDTSERLRALEQLREEDLVTPEEYERKRREILDSL